MADTGDDVLFQSPVEHENKPHILLLTKYQLSWEAHSKCKLHDGNISESTINSDSSIDLCEVIGIKPIKIPPKISTLGLKKKYKLKNDTPVCIEMQPLGPVGFSVYVVQRAANCKWRYRYISFQCKDSNICQQWINVIKEALKAPEFNRPRNVIVFVNPYSGKKRAPKIYKDKVLPLLELADISVHTIETQRQNHAKDLVEHSLDLRNIDGLVCVGGDGIFSEILNGLLNRQLKEADILQTHDHQPISPGVRIGIIPAGSTDTIAHTTNGVGDPVTSTLHIILGDSVGIDVNSVNVNGQFNRYSVTVCGYGYLGDLLKDSENKRWMGPKRYDWSGTKTFLANRSYSGELKFRLSENTDSTPYDKDKCYTGCETCSSSSTPSSQTTDDVSAGRDTDSIEIQTDTSEEWTTIQGKYSAVNAVTMSCSCDLSPQGLSPSSHLGDGCLDLLIIPDCSRFSFLRCLYRAAKGEHLGLPLIKMYRVKEFSFHPLPHTIEIDIEDDAEKDTTESKKTKSKSTPVRHSVWNCDGELIRDPRIHLRVHRQLVKLFARGLEKQDTVAMKPGNRSCCASTEKLD